MNARFLRLHLMPLWVCFGLLQSCRFLDIGLIDYPPTDHTQLKGPSDKTLETRAFRLAELITYPFYGSTLQVNQQFLLLGHNEAAGRLAMLSASGVSELPKSDLSSLSATPSGSIWGIKIQNEGFLIRHLTNGNWVDEGTVNGVNYYQTVRVTEQALWFTTSKGLVIWDSHQKKISQRIDIDRSRVFTENFSIESTGDQLIIYQNQAPKTPIMRFPLPAYLTVRKGIANTIWGVHEDKNQHLWFVVKDARWDGILFKFDGKNLSKLSTIPVGNYDSGRSVSHYNLDETGNLWVRIDGINYVYTTDGKWLFPQFDVLENTLYSGAVFTDPQGNLVIATSHKLFSITP